MKDLEFNALDLDVLLELGPDPSEVRPLVRGVEVEDPTESLGRDPLKDRGWQVGRVGLVQGTTELSYLLGSSHSPAAGEHTGRCESGQIL